jgi:hypothetical protein
MGNPVVMLGREPRRPRLDRHVTFHLIDIFVLYVRTDCVCDADRYVYIHGVDAESPTDDVHSRPGPAHDAGAEPSPGE